MKHKFLFISTLFFIVPTFALFAQNRNAEEQKRQELEQFRVKRIAYFTKEIGLTEDEAKEFWPIFNELEEKKFVINRNMRQAFRKIRETQKAGKNISDAVYDKLIDTITYTKEKEVEVEKEYLKKMRTILSSEKVFKYQRAEYRFTREAFSTPNNKSK